MKKISKKLSRVSLLGVLSIVMILSACSKKENTNSENAPVEEKASSAAINVISREQGSGTRGAFVEITGILSKNDAGEKVDNTSEEAAVQNSTNGVITGVAGDVDAIGYISLGSLNDTVKALKVEGVEATSENIKNASYKLARAFNIVYKDELSEGTQDFLNYILSDEGQKIVEETGYVSEMTGTKYEASNNSESITIAGSTSVTPLMEKLIEGYKQFNPEFNAEIQATGSSSGIKAAMDKTVELGMASRELKEEEKVLNVSPIARDGIAVIVNKENTSVEDVTIENIKDIFEGTVTNWDNI